MIQATQMVHRESRTPIRKDADADAERRPADGEVAMRSTAGICFRARRCPFIFEEPVTTVAGRLRRLVDFVA